MQTKCEPHEIQFHTHTPILLNFTLYLSIPSECKQTAPKILCGTASFSKIFFSQLFSSIEKLRNIKIKINEYRIEIIEKLKSKCLCENNVLSVSKESI